MDLVILQPVPPGRTVPWAYRDEVALLGAALRARGHTVTLRLLAADHEAALTEILAEARPALVLMYVESLAADLAVRTAGLAASVRGAPLIVFGPHARLCPDRCLSLPGAEAVAVGPADVTIPPYLEQRGSSLDSSRSAGFWVKCETGVMKNPWPAAPKSLAGQPPAARDLYPPEHVLDAAGFAYVAVARGGRDESPGAEPPGETPWSTAGWPVRHRPVAECLAEILAVTDEQLDLGGWRIGNPHWASLPTWLAEFAERYRKEVRLPIRTALRVADVKDLAASLLARAGCEEVTLHIGSASNLIRNEILRLDVSGDALVQAFDTLRRAGIRTVARVEVGTPYETGVTLDETAALLGRLDPDRVEAVLHYPEPGSHAWEVAKENGWLVPDPASAHLAGQPAVVPPSLSAGALVAACELLPYVVHRPRLVPLLKLARRVRIGKGGTVFERIVKPFLGPPVRRKRS